MNKTHGRHAKIEHYAFSALEQCSPAQYTLVYYLRYYFDRCWHIQHFTSSLVIAIDFICCVLSFGSFSISSSFQAKCVDTASFSSASAKTTLTWNTSSPKNIRSTDCGHIFSLLFVCIYFIYLSKLTTRKYESLICSHTRRQHQLLAIEVRRLDVKLEATLFIPNYMLFIAENFPKLTQLQWEKTENMRI